MLPDAVLLDKAIPVSEAVSDISDDLSDYYFLSEYTGAVGSKCLPTSFRIPIMYVNAAGGLDFEALKSCENIADLNSFVTETLSADWRISNRAADMIYEDCSDGEKQLIDAHRLPDDEAAAYEIGADPVFIGLSTDLKRAMKKATITMRCVPGHEHICQLTGMWCVASNESENRVRASKLLLVKLLNASAQESISASTNCFPLKKLQCDELMKYSSIILGVGNTTETPEEFMSSAVFEGK